MKVEITKAQLRAIIDIKNDISKMIGCGDDDSSWIKNTRLIERFLKSNGFS